jgi:hypothetical protein
MVRLGVVLKIRPRRCHGFYFRKNAAGFEDALEGAFDAAREAAANQQDL